MRSAVRAVNQFRPVRLEASGQRGASVRQLRVGNASADLRFFRKDDGKSGYEVLDTRGKLKILGEASPWALNATLGELHGVFDGMLRGGSLGRTVVRL